MYLPPSNKNRLSHYLISELSHFWKIVVLKDLFHIFLGSLVGAVVFASYIFRLLICICDIIHESFTVPELSCRELQHQGMLDAS